MSRTNFPWTFSNIADVPREQSAEDRRSEEPHEGDSQVPGTQRYVVKEINGVKIGLIGLVEKE